jgi:hypothetical protein
VNQRTNTLLQSMESKKNVLEELHNIAYLIQEANDLVDTLKKQRTQLINNGREVGVSFTDMATTLGVSRQRLYQIMDKDR